MSKVPAGWGNYSVGELFDVQLGKMLNQPAKQKQPQYRYLGNSNVKWGRFEFSNLNTMHFSEKEIEKFTLNEGDILMCEGGEIGRCAIWRGNDEVIFYQKALHRLRSKGKINPEFFQNIMQNIAGTKHLDDFSTRTSIAHLTREKLLKLKVNVPPLPEQTKIAQILSTWDKAIATTEKLIGNSQQQKKALMQSLLTGKRRLPGFEGEWKTHQLAKMGKIVSGGTPDTNNPQFWDGDILWMTPTDVTALKTKYIKNTSRKITKIGVQESSAKAIPAGSLLVCTRATIGLMSISSTEITTNQGFKNLVPNEKFNVEFLYFLFSFYKKYFIRYACGSTFLELSKKDFEKLEFSCPLYTEQQKIAAILTAADNEIDLLQKKLAFLKQEKAALMQQLLTGKRRVKVEAG